MIACILAALVFGVMSIFSAKYRDFAKEAMACAFRTITLRKCDTELDKKLRSIITAKVAKFSPALAGMVYKYFEFASTLFIIIFILSTAYFVIGIYNYAVYGNCNGPESTDVCWIDPLATGQHGFSRVGTSGQPIPPTTLEGDVFGNGSIIVYEFGCYSCGYTKNAEKAVRQILLEYGENITYVFKPLAIPNHPYSKEMMIAVECAKEQGKYWEYRTAIFEKQSEIRNGGIAVLLSLANRTGLDPTSFTTCMNAGRYDHMLYTIAAEANASHIYGTPTFFIGNQSIVGSCDYNQLKDALDAALLK